MDRRAALKTFGLTLGAAAVRPNALTRLGDNVFEYSLTGGAAPQPMARPMTAITIGAGNRGNVYGGYAAKFTDQIKIIGVAEPVPIRNKRFMEKHGIPAANSFTSWEQVFERPKFADAVMISTPDQLHYAPCMAALAKGYDVLLEKPIAPTERECRNILAMAKKTGNIVAVCHVLRYAPYFVKMKELVGQGAVGDVISVQHMEPIEHVHMSHAYVRGKWHNSKTSSPIILAKSCHDLDIIKWVIGRHSKRISAMGDLRWFKLANAPKGSTERCLDGCAVAATCPYYAPKVYITNKRFAYVFDFPDDPAKHDEHIMQQLRTSDYGRCVYRMDNDQPDHYVSSIEFDGNITANFNMEAFTSYAGRRTRIMGSKGDMVGDMTELVVTNFESGAQVKLLPKAEDVENYQNAGHGGGDWLLMRDFVQAISQQNPKLLTSTIDESIESHVMGFRAEQSRKSDRIVPINM